MFAVPNFCPGNLFTVNANHTDTWNCRCLNAKGKFGANKGERKINVFSPPPHAVSMVTSVTCRCKDITRSLVPLDSFGEFKFLIRIIYTTTFSCFSCQDTLCIQGIKIFNWIPCNVFLIYHRVDSPL